MLETETVCFRPCLVLAHTDAAYAAGTARAFRRLGWDAYTARNGPEARRLVRLLGAGAAVLDADLPGESGWLTCAKLVHENALVKVVLVAPYPDARQEECADFVGASALVDRTGGLPALLEVVEGATLPAAG